mmetsp:Transcript_122196/g.345506  ORF Transcript_122196/g.345506 Transcript_122196/m.345506 type:complete len:359 (-) Transcript_122196:1253-2329(-)
MTGLVVLERGCPGALLVRTGDDGTMAACGSVGNPSMEADPGVATTAECCFAIWAKPPAALGMCGDSATFDCWCGDNAECDDQTVGLLAADCIRLGDAGMVMVGPGAAHVATGNCVTCCGGSAAVLENAVFSSFSNRSNKRANRSWSTVGISSSPQRCNSDCNSWISSRLRRTEFSTFGGICAGVALGAEGALLCATGMGNKEAGSPLAKPPAAPKAVLPLAPPRSPVRGARCCSTASWANITQEDAGESEICWAVRNARVVDGSWPIVASDTFANLSELMLMRLTAATAWGDVTTSGCCWEALGDSSCVSQIVLAFPESAAKSFTSANASSCQGFKYGLALIRRLTAGQPSRDSEPSW